MATFIAGDLQGCLKPLKCVLKQANFNDQHDRLWLVGDIVNRGPKSLKALRFVYERRDHVQVVLGNHDLHLLAVAHGVRKPAKGDTIDEILKAKDCDTLLGWLIQQPLMYTQSQVTMVHAGIAPNWSLEQAQGYANEVQAMLRSSKAPLFFESMYGNEPDYFDESQTGVTRLRSITNVFTRMRFCTPSGRLDLTSKGPSPSASELPNPFNQTPEPVDAWFNHPHQIPESHRIVFGHWAALEGRCPAPHALALDTGCVWGGSLTLYELEQDRFFRCPCKNGKPLV
jgi:bis(5'-nucleosyl)-tetraphosphatase (symmetrical)